MNSVVTSLTTGPRIVAVIPARGGSKGVPRKNLRRVAGVSLLERAVRACRRAARIDAVYVSTDDSEIAAIATALGAGVIERPAALAGDTASSESALLHALDRLAEAGADPEVLVFVQCTSPFIDPAALDRGVDMVLSGQADSVFAGVPTYDFLWRLDPRTRSMAGQNHDAGYRPRRQDRRPDFRETGAFYVGLVDGFRVARHRFFGRTDVIEVPALTAVDVDTEADLVLASAVATLVEDAPTRAVDVDVVITDFDGVHTDDHAELGQDGREAVRVHRGDGLGVARLRAAGVPLLIVSTETNPVVGARAAKLGVPALQGVPDKAAAVRRWLAEHDLVAARAAYLGNDVNDLGAMEVVGWPVAVADARPEVRRAARLTLFSAGGQGAVRELCDLVLAARRAPAGPTASEAAPAGADAVRELLAIR